jgi:hypothetical protein
VISNNIPEIMVVVDLVKLKCMIDCQAKVQLGEVHGWIKNCSIAVWMLQGRGRVNNFE